MNNETPAVRTYLDYNASAPLRPEAHQAMLRALAAGTGNGSSVHWAGRAARLGIESARAEVASLLGAAPTEIVLTSGGTEANNLAIRGVCGGRVSGHIVTTAVEHASVLETCRMLEARGLSMTAVGVDRYGRVDPGMVGAALCEETVLVSVGLANNEVGTVQPVVAIGERVRARGIPFHVDAVQAAGKIPVSVHELGVDLLSLSAHKLGGPQGIGALYVRSGLAIGAQQSGGPQELGRRAGTESVAAAVGFGVAARVAASDLAAEGRRQHALMEALWGGIAARVPDAERNSPRDGVVPNTLNLTIPGGDADGLVIGFDLEGIAVSAGSACAAGSLEPSHVLLAMGRSPAAARAGLRLSVGHATSERDVEAFLQALPGVVARCRHALEREAG